MVAKQTAKSVPGSGFSDQCLGGVRSRVVEKKAGLCDTRVLISDIRAKALVSWSKAHGSTFGMEGVKAKGSGCGTLKDFDGPL